MRQRGFRRRIAERDNSAAIAVQQHFSSKRRAGAVADDRAVWRATDRRRPSADVGSRW
jgi:hypothetical protein